MSFLKNLFSRFFGTKAKPVHERAADAISESFMERWEREQQQRADSMLSEVRPFVLQQLSARGAIPFTWESGGDESFVDFPGLDAALEDDYTTLGEYLTFKLSIPDAGEFQMHGKGDLYHKEGAIWARFSSVYREIVDFNEDTEEEVFGEEETVAEEERPLFPAALD